VIGEVQQVDGGRNMRVMFEAQRGGQSGAVGGNRMKRNILLLLLLLLTGLAVGTGAGLGTECDHWPAHVSWRCTLLMLLMLLLTWFLLWGLEQA
jgi:hypothetical protein